MKKYFVLAAMLLLGQLASGQTQTQMNQDAAAEYRRSEATINQLWAQVMKRYANQPATQQGLRKAQRLWIQFRDAELKARFPMAGSYGSAEPMCRQLLLKELTDKRMAELKLWLQPTEGDVCNGAAGG